MSTEADTLFLRRAIDLAMLGRGSVEPNPMVGCVLVREGRVIGEGFHAKRGGPHAEPTALAACTESPARATAYVTLEPCCHTNKLTPPCAPRLIAVGIARVVIGCLDPTPAVNGNGVRMLREAGIVVDGPLLEPQCKQLIAPLLKKVSGDGPYITMKWAESADGKVAGPGGKRVQISGPEAGRAVHALRGRCDAVCVGINTVLNDDPLLLPRGVPVLRWPRRFVLDTNLRLPLDCQLVRTAREHPVTVFSSVQSRADRASHAAALRDLGVEVVDEIDDDATGHLSISEVLQEWSARHLTHVLIEPGPTLAHAWPADRLWVIRSSRRIADSTAPVAAPVPAGFIHTGDVSLGDDVLGEYLNPESNAYFAAERSADVMLAGR